MDSGEKELRKNRLTVNVNDFYKEIITRLKGLCGDSISSVIYYILRDWIINNTEKFINTYGIDIVGIRREYQLELNESIIEKKLTTSKKKLIESFSQCFKGISKINIEDLATQLNVTPTSIRDLFFYHYEDLQKLELDLILVDKIILNKKIKS